MASPPFTYSPTALSPPYPSHTQLPSINTNMNAKKRGSEGGSAPAHKRRKASAISISSGIGSAHPLRQTSFPPDEAGSIFDPRSPSVDPDALSLAGGSQANPAAPVKKKRGRKSKAEKALAEALEREKTPSVVGGKGAAAPSGGTSDVAGRSGKNAGAGAGEDGDGEDDGPTEVAVTSATMTKEQKEEEHRMRGILYQAFSPEQFDRFENWRAANLSKAAVRRLVNATISQSVTEPVVIGMRAVGKLYIGDIIESARRVQAEWIAKSGEKQSDLPTPPATAVPSPNVNGEGGDSQATVPAPVEERRGPLRPEHIREAVRRYRLTFEGGGVGMQRIWNQQQQNGVDRFPTRTGGRRIFR
ncbi:hTAFII28-like protein conserved region-domain-containing protein [Schizothecium vesticola]|uniref:HTAFII28-like protein conserved region-domain-containing protein n=1 Tax=Schizothecium vesticola TaxID=314040 RepID=A0AA40EL27_9PEZI|nr:hTAFII28-like protein conserved region-domain-containing protein [Schizothecium vesticola]